MSTGLPRGSLSMLKGKVVLVLFPFDDLSAGKVRPAVCLTEPIGPNMHIVLAFITSRIPKDLEATDVVIDTKDPEFQNTGLCVSSTVRLHRLMTVSASIIRRELGVLSPAMMAKVDDRLRTLFNL